MARKKRSAGATFAIIVIAAVLVAGLGYFVHAYFQVRHVVSQGNALYTEPYIVALADVKDGTHMFQVDQEAIRAKIEGAEPYLRVAGIQRSYPDTLIIGVEERRPVALLPYGSQYLLVDGAATALETVNDPEMLDIPVVEGISVDSVEIGAPIETQDAFKISVMQEILHELNARSLYDMIVSVDLSNINNIQITSENGLKIRFGQAEKVPDKVKWIANRLPALEREGQSDGILDVSAGSFATYTMVDGAGASQEPRSSEERDNDEEQAEESTEPSASSNNKTGDEEESSASGESED